VVCAGKTNCSLVEEMNQMYPGRAAMAPLLDVLITLLSLGASGWKQLLEDRETVYTYMVEKMTVVAEKHGERVLTTPGNPISIGVTLQALESHADLEAKSVSPKVDSSVVGGDTSPPSGNTCVSCVDKTRHESEGIYRGSTSGLGSALGTIDNLANQLGDLTATTSVQATLVKPPNKSSSKTVTMLGSMLFSRAVSGVRTIARGVTANVAGQHFIGFGSSHDRYPVAYMTAAAALGTSKLEVDTFCHRLDACLSELHTKIDKKIDKKVTSEMDTNKKL